MNRIVLVMIYGHSRIIPDDSRLKEVERECPQMVRELSPLIFMVIHGRFPLIPTRKVLILIHTTGEVCAEQAFQEDSFSKID